MILDIEKIKAIMYGAEAIKEVDGKLRIYRFNDAEIASENNPNLHYSAGVRLVCKTDASAVKIKITVKNLGVRSYFALDVLCDGALCGSLTNCNDTNGNFAKKQYQLGDFCGELKLCCGEKLLEVVLPHSVVCEFESIELVDATFIEPVKRSKKLLSFGDSITQGYDALHPINSYASMLADILDAELFDKGLGGAGFCPGLVKAQDGITPDYITVAYGTNDWFAYDADVLTENCRGFMKALAEKYPEVPTIVITPIWRADMDRVYKAGTFSDVAKIIENECKPYKNMTVVSGLSLVPGKTELFGDTKLHPNDDGFKFYAENLAKLF